MIITATSTKPAIMSAGVAKSSPSRLDQGPSRPGEAEGAHAGEGCRAALALEAHQEADGGVARPRASSWRGSKGRENSTVGTSTAVMRHSAAEKAATLSANYAMRTQTSRCFAIVPPPAAAAG